MTETKLDFDPVLIDANNLPILAISHIDLCNKLKQVCQAVDEINERLDKLNLENCNHTIKSGSILIDGKCKRCGEIT